MLEQHATISPKDLDLIPVVDTPEEVSKIITDFYSDGSPNNVLSPNYNF